MQCILMYRVCNRSGRHQSSLLASNNTAHIDGRSQYLAEIVVEQV